MLFNFTDIYAMNINSVEELDAFLLYKIITKQDETLSQLRRIENLYREEKSESIYYAKSYADAYAKYIKASKHHEVLTHKIKEQKSTIRLLSQDKLELLQRIDSLETQLKQLKQ